MYRRRLNVRVSDPIDLQYCGYFLSGLDEISGGVRLMPRKVAPDTGSPHIACVEVESTRLVFDAADAPELAAPALAWCDAYCKVNPRMGAEQEEQKLVPSGPLFGARWRGVSWSLLYFACTAPRLPPARWRDHLARCLRSELYGRSVEELRGLRRHDGDCTFPLQTFHASGLWRLEAATNELRAEFMRACMEQPDLRFEGGFSPRSRSDVPGYADLTMQNRLPYRDYLRQTVRSAFVFSTPAVAGCHGWKLGEYLALGKAILTTAISRALPSPLVHGRHVHQVDASAAGVRAGVERLVADADYRRRLEKGAAEYFDRYLMPRTVAERALDRARELAA